MKFAVATFLSLVAVAISASEDVSLCSLRQFCNGLLKTDVVEMCDFRLALATDIRVAVLEVLTLVFVTFPLLDSGIISSWRSRRRTPTKLRLQCR